METLKPGSNIPTKKIKVLFCEKMVPDFEKLGPIRDKRDYVDGGVIKVTEIVHTLCGSIVCIGKYKGELFKYCPRCGVVVDRKAKGQK